MLGTLDDQRFRWIEALVAADGERVMAGVTRLPPGVEWEALLVETQSLLQRIAMVRLAVGAGNGYGRD